MNYMISPEDYLHLFHLERSHLPLRNKRRILSCRANKKQKKLHFRLPFHYELNIELFKKEGRRPPILRTIPG